MNLRWIEVNFVFRTKQKDAVLESMADKIIEEVIFEELDEYCEDEFCDVHHKWISETLTRHRKIRQNDPKKKKIAALEK